MNQPTEKKRTNSMWASIIIDQRAKCEKIRIFYFKSYLKFKFEPESTKT